MRRRYIAPVAVMAVALAGTPVVGNAQNTANGTNVPSGQSAPLSLASPSMSGSFVAGQTVSASTGQWSNGPSQQYSFQWMRCSSGGDSCGGVGSGGSSYDLGSGDVGATLRVVVTATNKNGTTVATSDASPVVAAAPAPSAPAPTTTTAAATTTATTTTAATTTTTPTPTTTTTSTTTTTTTTTGTTAVAAPKFVGDWETDDVTQWNWGMQCSNVGDASTLNQPNRGTLNVMTSPVGQGSFSGQFALPAYTSGTSACEALRHRTLAAGGVYGTNGDDWFALDVRFPTNWQEPSSSFWGMALAQFNYERITGPPVGLFAHADHVNIVLQSGYCVLYGACTYTTGNDDDRQGSLGLSLRAIPSTQFSTGAWHQLIVHVHWATDSSGRIEVWHRLKGASTWSKTVDFSGYPTLQWTDTVPISALSTYDQSADKIGAYRGPASFPLTIWDDGFCVTTSFDSAAACLAK